MTANRWHTASAALLVLLLWSVAATAAVTARLDRSAVYEGDSVILIIEADTLSGGEPDLSALESEFDVLGTATGSQIQIVNGRQSATRTWQVTLAPKRLGTIQLPAIEVGGERTSELMLSVTEVPQSAAGAPGDDVFLELDVGGDGGSVYVHQQVPVTARLFSALPLRLGELSTPQAEGAVLERLGDDVQYSTNRNGRRYQVIERRFSLSPERSGELRIPPVSFKGELRSGNGGPFGNERLAGLFRDPVFERFGGGLFEQGESVRARSGAATLDVQPQPEAFGGRWWLPAQALAIDDSWERDPPELGRGEPVTRTLTISATGLAGSQIPEIEMPAPASVRVYPEAVDAETRTDGEQLFGVSRQQLAVMPTADGGLTFPEIRLRWWDVTAGRERVATVPARRFDVAGAGGGAEMMAPDSAQPLADGVGPTAEAATQVDAADDGSARTAGTSVPNRLADTRRPVGWLLLGVLAAGVLALLWRRRHNLPRRRHTASARRAAPRRRAADPGAALHAASAVCDAHAAATALLALARRAWGPAAPVSLNGIAARLQADGSADGAGAAQAVRELEASLYGPKAGEWQDAALADRVVPLLRLPRAQPCTDDTQAPLAPLYPQRG